MSLSYPLNSSVSPFLVPFIYRNEKKFLPFHIPRARKRYPLRVEPPRIIHYRESPPECEVGKISGFIKVAGGYRIALSRFWYPS